MRPLLAKAWCESRARFVVACAFVLGACAVFVVFEATFRGRMVAVGGPPLTFPQYIDDRIFRSVVHALYLLLAVVLGLGGLARERGQGTLGFTLALPVPRERHHLARVAVGIGQLVVLAALPVAIVAPTSYSLAAALGHAGAWVALALPIFAIGILISVAIPNEYAALAIAIVALRYAPRMVPFHAGSATAVACAFAVACVAIAGATLLARRTP